MRMRLLTTSFRLFAEMKLPLASLTISQKEIDAQGEGKKARKAMLRHSTMHVSLA